jgi:hypothetical protein
MIDNFALGVSHGLLLLVAWRLVMRPDVEDDAPAGSRWFGRPRSASAAEDGGRPGA